MTGIWNNQYYSPDIHFYCAHSTAGLSYYKPGKSPVPTDQNNFRISTGDKATQTSTKKTFVESICVESDDGNNLDKCGFGT